MLILTLLRGNIDSDELGDPFYAKIASCQAILGPKRSKMFKKSIFEVHKSNTTGPLGPPRVSMLLILTFLRENIDSDKLGDPSYAKIVSCQEILGQKPSKMVKKSIFFEVHESNTTRPLGPLGDLFC